MMHQTLKVMTRTHSNPKNSWVTYPRPNPKASIRLFCFPYSGAGASVFYRWTGSLPQTIELCPIQLPGRETRLGEQAFTRLTPLVRSAAEGLLPHMDRPFAFFGHSMGALISFELSRYMHERYGLAPLGIFVSGRNAPQAPDTRKPFHTLPEEEFIREVCGLNGMAQEVLRSQELMQMLIPILRADFAVCETHIHKVFKPLDWPIVALGGLQDKFVSREGLEAWGEQTIAPFKYFMFPGDHFYLNINRELLLEVIFRELNTYR